MKIAVEENIMIKNEICVADNFKSPYSATVIDKIINAGMTISDKNEAEVILGIDVDINSNLIYIKPTYGTVSRFGVVANVSSVDQIGVYAKNIDDGFKVLSVIAGHDKNDGTTYPTEKYEYNAGIFNPADLKIIESPDFKLKEYLKPVYMIISAAEFSGNTARFDGLKFGYRTENFRDLNDMVINSRSESFTTETKLKILLGTYVLSEKQFEEYYLKATKIRRLIKQEFDRIFTQADAVIMPASCEKAIALANLTGCPAVIINGKIIIAKEFGENKLFAVGKKF